MLIVVPYCTTSSPSYCTISRETLPKSVIWHLSNCLKILANWKDNANGLRNTHESTLLLTLFIANKAQTRFKHWISSASTQATTSKQKIWEETFVWFITIIDIVALWWFVTLFLQNKYFLISSVIFQENFSSPESETN